MLHLFNSVIVVLSFRFSFCNFLCFISLCGTSNFCNFSYFVKLFKIKFIEITLVNTNAHTPLEHIGIIKNQGT